MSKRTCINANDAAQILGKTARSGRRLLKKIRTDLGKSGRQFITIKEFADFTGIPESEIDGWINH